MLRRAICRFQPRNLISRVCRPQAMTSRYAFAAAPTSPPPRLNDIDHDSLIIKRTSTPKPKLPNDKLKFGKSFTDHMLEIDWDNKTGWKDPVIRPYGPFQIEPAASVFHYSLEAFEGLKAYVDSKNNIRLFRARKNMERLNNSCRALFFPTFDGEEFLECIFELLRLEKDWIPKGEGFSLYIRPTIISTYPYIGVAASEQVKLYVILSPVGAYYAGGFQPVKLLADDKHIRAWPKGSGDKKLGGNYGPTILPQFEAAKQGYDQIMWLFGDQHYVTEVGTMNQFFFWTNEKGKKELVTAPLDGTILPGVTRDSILTLAREWKEFEVSERPYTMKEVVKALDEGRVLEAFGAGTAAIVSPVCEIGYKGKRYKVPVNKDNPNAKIGPLAERLYRTLIDIQYGRVEHPWSIVVPEKK